MASVLLAHENQGEDKHVESILLPRSDTGSNPVSSTIFLGTKKSYYQDFLVSLFVLVLNNVNGGGKTKFYYYICIVVYRIVVYSINTTNT